MQAPKSENSGLTEVSYKITVITVIKYIQNQFWGKNEHRSHGVYQGFSEEITSKKVRTQNEKKEKSVILSFVAIYLQRCQFFHCGLHTNNRQNRFKIGEKKIKCILLCPERQSVFILMKSMEERRNFCPQKDKQFRSFRELEGLIHIFREFCL